MKRLWLSGRLTILATLVMGSVWGGDRDTEKQVQAPLYQDDPSEPSGGEGSERSGLEETAGLSGAALDRRQLALSPDGTLLIFSARLPLGAGGLDLHVSFLHPNGTWVGALNLGPGINTPADEVLPTFSEDGRVLFFSRGSKRFGVDLSALLGGWHPRSF